MSSVALDFYYPHRAIMLDERTSVQHAIDYHKMRLPAATVAAAQFVQFCFRGLVHAPIKLSALPPQSRAAQLAAAHMCDNWALVPLDDECEQLDGEAVYCVLIALARGKQRPPAQPEPIKLDLMYQMLLVCEALGLDFDTLIRPRFATLDAVENCRFAAVNNSGELYFADHHVYITYKSAHVRIAQRFAYVVSLDGTITLFGDADLRLRFDGTNIVLELYNNGALVYSDLFVNQTAERLHAPAPAIPTYRCVRG